MTKESSKQELRRRKCHKTELNQETGQKFRRRRHNRHRKNNTYISLSLVAVYSTSIGDTEVGLFVFKNDMLFLIKFTKN